MKEKYRALAQRGVPKRAVCAVLGLALAAALAALIAAGMYVQPQADDFGFSSSTHVVWAETHSFFAVVRDAWRYAMDTYRAWQGSYSACFLMAMQPGLFGFDVYRITAPLLLGSFTGAAFFLLASLRRTVLRASKADAFLAGAAIVLLQLLFTPTPNESWYWYNGAIYYTFFFSGCLVMLGLALRTCAAQTTRGAVAGGVGLALLGAFLGGGPFSAIMVTLALLAVGGFAAFRSRSRGRWGLLVGFIFLAAGFVVNMTAPGNAVRGAQYTDTPGAVRAVYLAVMNGTYVAARWMNLAIAAALVLLAPVLWGLAKNAKLSFRLPVVAIGFAFGLMAMMLCPPIYAMGEVGPDRLLNIVFFAYIWLLAFCEFYLLGWAQRHIERLAEFTEIGGTLLRRASLGLFVCCVLGFGFYLTCSEYRDNPPLRAAKIVANGEAATFRDEIYARYELYEAAGYTDVVVPDLTVHPFPIYHDDIRPDPYYFANGGVAAYFGNRTVRTP